MRRERLLRRDQDRGGPDDDRYLDELGHVGPLMLTIFISAVAAPDERSPITLFLGAGW
jgi:hypothetical protein